MWIYQNGCMKNKEQAFLAQIALGWFSVDSEGRIWRMVRFQGGGAKSVNAISPRRAERSMSKKEGYLRIMFTDWVTRKRLRVDAHRIVWMVYNKRTIPIGLEPNHEDGNKQNNNPSNLKAVTRSQNVIHSIRVLGRKSRSGESNPQAKLTAEKVVQIRKLGESGDMTQREIAEMFNVTQPQVGNVLSRHSWNDVQ